MNSQEAKELLKTIEWQEGKVVPITEGPYRHRIVAHCAGNGRQRAMFANGEHSYFCYVELLSTNGQWIQKGAGMVPVLPDGRFIMVVEQRPAHGRYLNRPMTAKIDGQSVDLNAFGQHSSLEFPGGAVDPNEGLKAAFLRELQEETGVGNQSAAYYARRHSILPFGSDIALEQYFGVVFLTGLSFERHVTSDGGLTVFALDRDEVDHNIWNGVIRSGQAALLQWAFYKEVERARIDPDFERMLKESGYLAVKKVQIAKT